MPLPILPNPEKSQIENISPAEIEARLTEPRSDKKPEELLPQQEAAAIKEKIESTSPIISREENKSAGDDLKTKFERIVNKYEKQISPIVADDERLERVMKELKGFPKRGLFGPEQELVNFVRKARRGQGQ